MAIFNTKLGQSSLTPEFELPEDVSDGIPEGTYYQHKLSSFVLNNCGSYLLQSMLFLSALVRFAEPLASKFLIKRRYLINAYGIIYEILVWNFPLAFFLAKYETVSLLVGVALRFPLSPMGFLLYSLR